MLQLARQALIRRDQGGVFLLGQGHVEAVASSTEASTQVCGSAAIAVLADQGRHEWACFAAHQATEKALKALHLALGQQVPDALARSTVFCQPMMGALLAVDPRG